MNISQAITFGLPDAQFSISNNDYDLLVWADDVHTKPKMNQIEAWWNEFQQVDLITTNESNAKVTRFDLINSDVEYDGVMWQVDDTSRDFIQITIDTAIRNGMEDETVTWILSDNSERSGTTLADLESVLNIHAFRLRAVFDAYRTWRAGDRLTPFEV